MSGNKLEKTVRNGLSDRVNCLLLNDRDGTSAMSLSTPAIPSECRGDALFTCIRIPRTRSRCAAMSDVELVSLYVHWTAEALSQKIATDMCLRDVGVMCSSTSQCSKIPAISRSLIVTFPVGLEALLKLLTMSVGSCILHTVG